MQHPEMVPHKRVRRLLLCPNAFKGSLTAMQAAQAMRDGIARIGADSPFRFETILMPLADGGDGTLETLTAASGGEIFRETVTGPLGLPVTARWGRMGGVQSHTAVIEMAEAAGLRLLRPAEYDPEHAATFGVGELMLAALAAGCRTLLIGIGGSATNDGGAGMAQALGARFLDAAGNELPPGGTALHRLARIDRSDFRLPAGTRVIVACDVDNPLTGAHGAAHIYGPQKGATMEQAERLDDALRHYGGMLREQIGADTANRPGAGAAGGLGAGLMAFCGAELRPGIDLVMEATGFEAALRGCALALTGEGRLDGQTGRGKVIAGVAKKAQAAGVPVIALVGALADGAEAALRNEGLTAALCIQEGPISMEEAMQQTYRLLGDAAERTLRLLTAWLCEAPDLE